MSSKQVLSIIYNNWYAYGLNNPSEEQKNNFWLEVFNTQDDQFIKEKILNSDLDKILVQYIQHVGTEKKLNFIEVMEIFSLWWDDVLSEHKQKCAHILHSLLSDKNLSTGSEKEIGRRLNDMIQCEQWNNALVHHKPIEYPSHAQYSWHILKNIFGESKYTDETWRKTLDQLDLYLSNGGKWEDTDLEHGNKRYLLLMPLVRSIAYAEETQKLYDLFKRGIIPNPRLRDPLSKGSQKLICEIYDQYFKQVLTNEVLDETKTKTQRKI